MRPTTRIGQQCIKQWPTHAVATLKECSRRKAAQRVTILFNRRCAAQRASPLGRRRVLHSWFLASCTSRECNAQKPKPLHLASRMRKPRCQGAERQENECCRPPFSAADTTPLIFPAAMHAARRLLQRVATRRVCLPRNSPTARAAAAETHQISISRPWPVFAASRPYRRPRPRGRHAPHTHPPPAPPV